MIEYDCGAFSGYKAFEIPAVNKDPKNIHVITLFRDPYNHVRCMYGHCFGSKEIPVTKTMPSLSTWLRYHSNLTFRDNYPEAMPPYYVPNNY